MWHPDVPLTLCEVEVYSTLLNAQNTYPQRPPSPGKISQCRSALVITFADDAVVSVRKVYLLTMSNMFLLKLLPLLIIAVVTTLWFNLNPRHGFKPRPTAERSTLTWQQLGHEHSP